MTNYESPTFWGTDDEEERKQLVEYVKACAKSRFGSSDGHNLQKESMYTARSLWKSSTPPERAAIILSWNKV